MSDTLRERVLMAFAMASGLGILPDEEGDPWDEDITNGMDAAIALVLEEAARTAEAFPARTHGNLATAPYAAAEQAADEIAAAIRNLKEYK